MARVYDYWLGGKDNFADRAAGDLAIAAYPDIVFSVRANRTFLARAVTFRDRAGVARFFDGLDLMAPGMVRAPRWRLNRS